jgi:uncharacterized protein YfaS (alpha-2-macroglobulin family)
MLRARHALALTAVMLACGGPKTTTTTPPKPAPGAVAKPEPPAPGLVFTLTEGAEEAPAARPRPAPAKPLGAAETDRLLARLGPPPKEAAAPKEFALRERSLPPPRTGATVTTAFPPPVARPAPEQPALAALTVLRHAPEGDVPIAPNLSITFSEPMVAVTSHQELAAQAVPATLTPTPPGRWRWVGTKTLVFEPKGRFPMATEYRVTVPAGTRSATGATLAAAEKFAFATPPLSIVRAFPAGGPARLEPTFFLELDQRIDPAQVLRKISLRAGLKAVFDFELLDQAAAERDPQVQPLVAAAQPGRWLAFRAKAPLAPATDYRLVVDKGAPSAEGPRPTAAPLEVAFSTYGPFRVEEHRCGWGAECLPFQPWNVRMTNPVDPRLFDAAMVRVDPPLPGLKVAVYGTTLSISGRSKGRTSYTVTLAAALPDSFGQTLGDDTKVRFKVGEAPPLLSAPRAGFVVLDPAAGPRFSVYTINQDRLRLRLYAVEPKDYRAFLEYLRDYRRHDDKREPPGRKVVDTTVPVKAQEDELTETRLDLAPALSREGLGQLVLVVEAPRRRRESTPQIIESWVQATRIGLDAFVDPSHLTAWTTSLADGAPLDGVQLRLLPDGGAATSAAGGLASLPLDRGGDVLVARQGGDVAILPAATSPWGYGSGWHQKPGQPETVWYVFDDRQMYRPGEEVRLKGWLRHLGAGTGGDVEPAAPAGTEVSYALRDSRRNEVAQGRTTLGALGGFDLAVKLPPVMNLGHAWLELRCGGETTTHGLQVQEFRRPEFEVAASASEGPHLVGGHAMVTVRASYYAGGALPGADVRWTVRSSPGHFTPPNRADFTFGTWRPWWDYPGWHGGAEPPSKVEAFAAHTDSAGKHVLRIDFRTVAPPRPMSVEAEGTVTDVNRQAWTARAALLVHPADLYVGLRSERTFYHQGQAVPIESLVTDLDGRAVAGRPVLVTAERVDWVQEKGEYQEKLVDREECAVQSAAAARPCLFHPKEGGTWRVTARVTDEQGRPNQSQITVWVAGGKTVPSTDVEQEKVVLVPDRQEYRAGDVAELLMVAPFTPAEGVLTIRRSGLVATERFTLKAGSRTFKIPIREEYTPNLFVDVSLVGQNARAGEDGRPDPKLPRRPAYAGGVIRLDVPPRARTLAVAVRPREPRLEPGGTTALELEIKDAAGRPAARSEVAVVVVDEAILALTGYRIPDPLGVFYRHRGPDVEEAHLRASVVLAQPDTGELANKAAEVQRTLGMSRHAAGAAPPMPMPAPAMAPGAKYRGKDGGEAAPPIRTRTDFRPLALFAASVTTDEHGRAQLPLKLPDSLTRYRVTAVAVAGARRFGSGEATVTARLPLMVRPSPPRFLNFGDRFELPVVLQNQTDAALAVDVAVRAQNAALTVGQGRRVTVPANDRAEVRFPAAVERAGTAWFQIAAAAGRYADAADFKLPVWTPATTEAFATYGHIDQGAVAQPVRAPRGVFPQFGGLEITTSSTALQALTDAVLYLVAYPFECAEQIASRVMAIAALKDVLGAFQAAGLPSAPELLAAVKRDLERLRFLQRDDGGFAFWRRDEPDWPWLSVHVANALVRARDKGFPVDAGMLERSRQYLRASERHIPADYPDDVRRVLVAYALNVRQRLGDVDAAAARRLVREAGVEKLPLEGLGFVLPVLATDPGAAGEVAAIRRHLANRATETAGAAHFVTSYGDGAYLLLASDRRADAILLEALIATDAKNDLIPKIVTGLLAHRTAGRWGNTQENTFVLGALDRYFTTYEKVTPDFVARAWLGAAYAGEHAFRGRTTARHHIDVPMAALAAGPAEKNLILAKQGAGRLYYRIGLQYAPTDLKLPPADHGFTVERLYEAVDRPDDVRRDPDGTWRIKAGARVRVKVTMVAPTRRYHVALVDPLPAGLEALNPALAVTERIPESAERNPRHGVRGRHFGWWWGPWYQHQNLRDERAEAFTPLLWEGVHDYSYVARATTPGVFVVPPPKAEEMYHPETFGRGAGDRVIVE